MRDEDARFNIGEFMLPVMALVIVLTFIPNYQVQMYGILALWGFFIVAVVDSRPATCRCRRTTSG